MGWTLDKNRPICPQICEKLCVMIATGELPCRTKLFSVREVAVEAGVNPNTVQKSYEQLAEKGLIYSVHGSGWFVGDDISIAKEILDNLIRNKTDAYFEEMAKLNLSVEQIKVIVKEWQE